MNEKLATTLTQIAAAGVDIFYNGMYKTKYIFSRSILIIIVGAIGRMFAQDIQDAGGILTFEDLQNYSVREERRDQKGMANANVVFCYVCVCRLFSDNQ